MSKLRVDFTNVGRPTERQVDFAKAIKACIYKPLPKEYTFDAYQKYIHDNIIEYNRYVCQHYDELQLAVIMFDCIMGFQNDLA